MIYKPSGANNPRRKGYKTMTLKEIIYKINHEENFDKAQEILELFNTINGTKYGFLNKRVIRFNDPEIGYAAGCHDVWEELQ